MFGKAGHHELDASAAALRRTGLEILLEILEQRVASLVRLDAAEIQDERIGDAEGREIDVTWRPAAPDRRRTR